MKNFLDQKKQVKSSMSQFKLSSIGQMKENCNVLEQKVIIEDFNYQTSSLCVNLNKQEKLQINQNQKEKFAIAECPLTHKKTIWKDKLSSSEMNFQHMKLLKILDQASILKEKDLIPFWNMQSMEISKKLWLPTKIDYVDSVLSSSKTSFQNNQMGKSWFSIEKKLPLKKNLSMTSFQLSQFSLPDSMDSGAVKSKIKSENKQKEEEKKIKTLKFRIFPSEKEKEDIHLMFDQFRWYYNSSLTIFYLHYGYDKILNKNKYSNTSFRDILRKYRYEETTVNNLTFKDFIYDDKRNELMIPEWWKNNVHSRLPRGAVNKFISSINSSITNYKNKNINNFQMHFISKKSNTQYLHFEDSSYPSIFKHIKSTYWYRTKDRKRKFISLKDVSCQKRGIEIIYEKDTNKYFLHYPVDIDWFPDDDMRNDSQVKFTNPEDPKIISLDPGVRKFLVGYDPSGKSIFIGDGASKELTELLYTVDKLENKRYKLLLWRKIKNLVNELHWKTVSFLIKNYDIILLPDFRTSEMVKKKKLSRMTKRLMLMFSFHGFKKKLSWKCITSNKKLIIVDESFTSCTCTNCGMINNTKGKENLKCVKCNLEIDRDVAGSRNIMIKSLKKINIEEVV